MRKNKCTIWNLLTLNSRAVGRPENVYIYGEHCTKVGGDEFLTEGLPHLPSIPIWNATLYLRYSHSCFHFFRFNWMRKFFLHSILISHFAFKIFWFFFLANRETHTWSKYTNFNPKSLKLCISVNLKGKVPLWE